MSEYAPKDNSEWIKALRGDYGDDRQRQAFETLESYLNDAGFNFLRTKVSGKPKLAELDNIELKRLIQECTQETLMKIVEDDFAALERYRGESSFLGYVKTFVVNFLRRELKRKRNAVELPLDESAISLGKIEAVDHSAEGDPEQSTLILDAMNQLELCLKALSARSRTIFLMRVQEGYSIQEVAEQLNVTISVVKNHTSRAREPLRNCLEEAGYNQNILEAFK